ncbi:hypothetical protein ANO14919_122160 [Xylariales sp. No.14919]|nr:hypothetical protein ANO14919_122160 [Xylariales sp. No.14919]
MQALCINDKKGVVAAAPSADIIFKVSSSDVLADVQMQRVLMERLAAHRDIQSMRLRPYPACNVSAGGQQDSRRGSR